MWTRPSRVPPPPAENPNQFQCIHDLSDVTVRKLTRYLYLSQRHSTAHPPDYWLQGQEKGLHDLPSDCLRPRVDNLNVVNLVKRGLMSISEKHQLFFTPKAAVLCSSHRGLNSWTIHALFALVTKEITKETERLRRDRGGRNLEYSAQIQEFLHRLDAIQALWMDPTTFEMVFGRLPAGLEKVASQCEACILAAIGSRESFLGDLRANLIARTKTESPILQRVVESWLAHFPTETQQSINQGSSFLAEEIRTVRREIVAARQKRRDAKRQRRERWTPNLSSRSSQAVCVQASQLSATGRQFESSQQYLVSNGEDLASDVDDSNQSWEDAVGGFYERLAVQNGNGHAFDRNSVHPAFSEMNTQADHFRSRAFETGLEVERSEQDVIWEDAVSNSGYLTSSSWQSVSPSSWIRQGQQPRNATLPPTMLQDEHRVSNRFRNVATSSVFLNNDPAQAVSSRSEVSLTTQPYTRHCNIAPSSIYTNMEPARPHPPRTDMAASAARSQSGPSGSVNNSDPSRRSRPDAAVSNPSFRPQDNRPVIQDHPTIDPPRRPGLSTHNDPNWRAVNDERLRWMGQQGENVERMGFVEYYENKRKPKPIPPSGRRMHYGAQPSSTPPPPRSFISRTPSAPPPVHGSFRNPTLDEVHHVAVARGSVALSDVSTLWPHDSITSVGMPK
ncbi:hypothetical protein CTA2_7860 [Colletotrichum tanaceti]|uniref:Uncharacterized protein n=1 Tax=Colletotrichum tanaceti TaxID=1306861 RepID=A0A4U6XQH9_9PEZI|nr:hypothetical protein CTA2_7860 [Colletotrichum tanaceti]TKW58077.1 hypothetical protein CTA1_11110 [Colletotrichum tanaceti]